MAILAIMCLGIIIGSTCFNPSYKRIAEIVQLAATLMLIFSMGVLLGSREGLVQEIRDLGWKSLLLFFIPTVCSTLLVYMCTQKLFIHDSGISSR